MASRTAAVFDAADVSSPAAYKPDATALILGDYQNIVLGMAGEPANNAVTVASEMRSWAARHGVLVIHTLIGFNEVPGPTSRLASRWDGLVRMIASDPSLSDEVRSIANVDDITVHRKAGHISAMSSPEVRDLLAAKGIKSLIVSGISSSGVVLSTARAAHEENYVVTVIEDACADRLAKTHEVIMEHVLGTAHVARAEEIKHTLGKAWGR